MAKKRKNVDAEFEELKQNMPKGVKRTFEKEGINSMESLFLAINHGDGSYDHSR